MQIFIGYCILESGPVAMSAATNSVRAAELVMNRSINAGIKPLGVITSTLEDSGMQAHLIDEILSNRLQKQH